MKKKKRLLSAIIMIALLMYAFPIISSAGANHTPENITGRGMLAFSGRTTGLAPVGYALYARKTQQPENTSADSTPAPADKEALNDTDDGAATVVTDTASDITFCSASLAGKVVASGKTETGITECGFVCGTSDSPMIDGNQVQKVTAGSGTDGFTASLSDLTPNTMYYARAYVIQNGTAVYGKTVHFTTGAKTYGSIPGMSNNRIWWVVWILTIAFVIVVFSGLAIYKIKSKISQSNTRD